MATLFILIGAEGVAEMGDAPPAGIRLATQEEEVAFCAGLVLAKEQGREAGDYFIDKTGRPYWLIAVEDSAPPEARKKAEKYRRTLRLFD
jgi:hypothetical protein